MSALAGSNPRIRRLRRLSGRRSARVDERAFILEGPVLVADALHHGVPLEGVYVEPSSEDDPAVELARAVGIPVHLVAEGVLTKVSDVVTPRPLMAVAPLVATPLDEVIARAQADERPLVVLVEVGDPGNLGTIVRAAEASGAVGVVCTKGTVDPWSPKVVRASAGTVLQVAVSAGEDAAGVLDRLAEAGVPRLGTVVEGGTPTDDVALDGCVALVFGSESHGLGPAERQALDLSLTIPMEGQAESLNVAMAASVLCFEALRQRRASGRETGATTARIRLDAPGG